MLFNSYIFVFIFLPITLIGWYTLLHFEKETAAKCFLSAMSLWFYAYFNVSYLAVILSSIFINYLLSYLMKRTDKQKIHRLLMVLGILANLGILFYFKYFDFFLENVNAVFDLSFELRHIVLPLGISFFTFQQLSFIIDRGLGKAEHYSVVNYVTFVTFFPQLIAGPIVLYKEIIPQFEDKEKQKFISENFAEGITLFVIGLSKKVLLADVLAQAAKFGFAQTFQLDTISTILVILCYSFELYFDFSGYCDMAMGLSKMFNIVLPVNFNSPYKSCSFKELWQRWHITLSRFFITYVYIPLGGSRKGRARTLLNTFIVFVLSGLWHGAAWTFIAWGVMQGLLVVFDNLNLIGIKGREEKVPCKWHIPAWLGWFFTFGFFNLSLFFFRSESMAGAFRMFKNVFSFTYNAKMYDVAFSLSLPELFIVEKVVTTVIPSMGAYYYLSVLLIYLIACFIIIFSKNAMEITKQKIYTKKRAFVLAILFGWCIISLSQVSTFLYFNF